MSEEQVVLPQEVPTLDNRLSPAEDDELRRLHYMSQHGILSERSRERMLELRLRDRRQNIRPPREFDEGKPDATEKRESIRKPTTKFSFRKR